MRQIFIIGGLRTPIGKTGGILKKFLPEHLSALTLNAVIDKYHIESKNIDFVILGNAVGPGGNIARISVLKAGWPYSVPGITVDTQCGSGLASIMWAADKIQSGQSDLIIAGGVESTSMAPRRQFNSSDPRFKGFDFFYDRAPFSTPEIGDPEVGETGERLANLMNISRNDMDDYAILSHQKAFRSQSAGILKDIILPINLDNKIIDSDECIRPNLSGRLLKRMPSIFQEDGKVTAGNTCLKNDGAASILIASKAAVEKYNLDPVAEILGTELSGIDPNLFPLSPVNSTRKLSEKLNIPLDEVDAIEINEAFAVKVLAFCKKLGFNLEKINMLGGALAYGHPYGASGAVNLLHLIESLKSVHGKYGISTIGAVGGIGISMLIKMLNEE